MTDFHVNVSEALHGLKDFQHRTVDYVFRRMYQDSPPAKRFLIADEVGLGKTLVARGIIAKSVEHLKRAGVQRIDVLYICSNATIAQQNLNRLNVTDQETAEFATRLTLLPKQLGSLKKNGINFISFTPGTTFNLKSRGGRVDERALIYQMLHGHLDLNSAGLFNLLQGNMSRGNWQWWANSDAEYDQALAESYRSKLASDVDFIGRLRDGCVKWRDGRTIGRDQRDDCFGMVGELRSRLADACIDALEPDLVILDEFQRFKDLLHGDDEAAELAQQLFNHSEVRVLLLSATPYRMLTLDHEQDDDHYTDFIETLRFLINNETIIGQIKNEFRRFRQALYGLDGELANNAHEAQIALQSLLRSVIARTERIGATQTHNAMVIERQEPAQLKREDLIAARFVDQLARTVEAGDTIEYWKSSPYLVNFMGEYELKRRLLDRCKSPSAELHGTFRNADGELLRNLNVQRYREAEAGNPRLRHLLGATVHAGQWQWLWMPPSLPYTTPRGAYAIDAPATKSLIFSSWQVVPDAIAAICSYESERIMLEQTADRPRYSELHRKRRPLLQFRIDPDTKRPANMPALALSYPCATFANLIDPLAYAIEMGKSAPADVELVKRRVQEVIEGRLKQLRVKEDRADNRADARWYWAAPALLDAAFAEEAVEWTESSDGWRAALAGNDSEVGAAADQHVDLFVEVLRGNVVLGRRPDDLAEVLTEIALAGPAVCATRALRRIASELPESSWSMLSAAARIGDALRSQFNQPDVMSLLRGDDERIPYWRRVLHYCLDGNLQAVLDEYAHVLKESLGLTQRTGAEIAKGVANAMTEAMTLRTSSLRVDDIKATGNGRIRVKDFAIRCRFAMRFGDVRDDNNEKVVRAGSVRQAFNSPFRPFILASTSVGQEGLDFHPYCHAIYHWNLPANPVDLEQREGRVHRYKGHAVRRNVAKCHGLAALGDSDAHDPWDHLFESAVATRQQGMSDLVPFWLYEIEDGYAIERRVPLLPMSREVAQLRRLKQMLSVYRLAFGQPRQQDLIAYLAETAGAKGATIQPRICLAPPADELA